MPKPLKIGVSLSSLFNNDEAKNKFDEAISSGHSIQDAISEYRDFNNYSVTPLFLELKELLKINSTYDDNFNKKYNELVAQDVPIDIAKEQSGSYASKKQDFPDKIEIQIITKSAPKPTYPDLLKNHDFPISRHAYFSGNIRYLNNYVSKGLDLYISKNPISVSNLRDAGYENAILYNGSEHDVIKKIDEALNKLEINESLNNNVTNKVHSDLMDRRDKTLPSTNIKPLKVDVNINSLFNKGLPASSYNMINFMQSVNKTYKYFDVSVYSDADISQKDSKALQELGLSLSTRSDSAELNLTSDSDESRELLASGQASIFLPITCNTTQDPCDIKFFDFFFDGDAVVFGDEAERAYKEGSLKGFVKYEEENEDIPLSKGPFYSLFKRVSEVAMHINKDKDIDKTLGVCLLTARSAHNSSSRIAHHENHLHEMGLTDVVAVIFAGGSEKAKILDSLSDFSNSTASILIDDGSTHIDGVNLLNNKNIVGGLSQHGINHQ